MSHEIHENHSHEHGPNCGHVAVQHGDHVGYLHDGHLHCAHDDHYDEHVIEVSDTNPNGCVQHSCTGHEPRAARHAPALGAARTGRMTRSATHPG